ncbi:MAG: DNA translocase FtsK [Chloroflexota bacterium]|nr:DNA translocase FtsK [Chloroflexota bacterium]
MSTATAAFTGGFNWFKTGITAGVLVAAAMLFAVAYLAIPDFQDWLMASLGMGWVVVAGYGLALLLALVYLPTSVVRGWRWWLALAVVAIAAIGALTLWRGDSGASYAYGMAGQWGYALTGGHLWMWLIQLLGAMVIVSLLLVPQAWKGYLIAGRFIGIAVWATLVYAGIGAKYVAIGLALASVAVVRGARRLVEMRPGRVPASAEPKVPPAQPKEPKNSDAPEPPAAPQKVSISRSGGWQLPPLDTLAPPEPHQMKGAAIADMTEEIKDALAEHGVYVDVEDVKAGPRVIKFGLVPGYMPQRVGKDGDTTKQRPSRVRVGDITKRQKDLALALKSPYIRIIETPEPGEGLVGLEVPNPTPGKVLMRSIVEAPEFSKIVEKGGLAFALGEDAGGQSLALDLAAMPHLLIAGATGSGKSVCINSLVASLLMTRPPDELRMIMVDPKRVELTPFNGIPHLVMPVIVEPDDVQPALRGLINEMSRRYKLMEEMGVRNIAGYNAKADEPMCFLVLIVDELADLMMTGGLEVEQQLVRLAQLGRAAGIHMVLATQRPSVKVVTGLLKANVPARVAFAVASQVDSRVILDGAGAEALMGKGDLLLLNNDFPKARRGQGTLVYDDEMDRLVDFWRNQQGPLLPPIDLTEEDESEGDPDPENIDDIYQGNILDQARDLALRNPRLTSAMLERRFKVRKSIADELIEELRGEGLVIGG